jgi:hypothetical protein
MKGLQRQPHYPLNSGGGSVATQRFLLFRNQRPICLNFQDERLVQSSVHIAEERLIGGILRCVEPVAYF